MATSWRGPVSVLGRILLCGIFLLSAVGNKIPKFQEVSAMMGQAGVPLPTVMLAGAIVFLIVGSVSIIVGYRARLGALLLLIFLILATYYFHPAWKDPSDQTQMIQLMKNLSLMGAMVILIANGSGAGSLDERLQANAKA